jgi:hypothetical protein
MILVYEVKDDVEVLMYGYCFVYRVCSPGFSFIGGLVWLDLLLGVGVGGGFIGGLLVVRLLYILRGGDLVSLLAGGVVGL